jgi:predicted RNA-binding Zn-ribbon protein involved in translation (DUF1610 family)
MSSDKDRERVNIWQEKNKKICPFCGKKIYYRSKTCRDCFERNRVSKEIKNMTLGEFREKNKGRHPSWIYVEVRNFARSWNRNLRKYPCQRCGYNKHIELCHIKPVSTFEDNATLEEINGEHNLYVLCPNCHWEFDAGLFSGLDLKSINSLKNL